METFLFFSTEAGLAHVTRSLAIAYELKRRGVRVLFAVGKVKHDFVRRAGLQPIEVPIALPEGLAAEAMLKWQDASFVYHIVPETSFYLPPTEKTLDVSYVGPIFWNRFTTAQ